MRKRIIILVGGNNNLIQYAVIAAGGASMRFRPYSLSMTKEILPIAGVPAIQYVVDECLSANVNKIIIVSRPGNNIIADYFIANPQYKDLLANDFLQRGRVSRPVVCGRRDASSTGMLRERAGRLPALRAVGDGEPVHPTVRL